MDTKRTREYHLLNLKQDFSYTGTVQSFTIPSFVESIYVKAYGAAGTQSSSGSGSASSIPSSGAPGKGGFQSGTILVNPGTVYYIYVGGQSGWNGGASGGVGFETFGGHGGDATDIRTSVGDLSTRVIVAGGGGGSGNDTVCGVSYIGGGGDGGGGNAYPDQCVSNSCGNCSFVSEGGATGAGFDYGGEGEYYKLNGAVAQGATGTLGVGGVGSTPTLRKGSTRIGRGMLVRRKH